MVGLGEDNLSHQSQPPGHDLTGAKATLSPHMGERVGG